MAISDMFFIDAAGLRVPDYPTVLQYMQNEYRAIYGADTYLEADSQDGQWVAVLALAIFDTMQVAQAVYSSFSPATAQGDSLSRNVKINGLSRLIPSHSTVDLRIVGQVGSIIRNGQAEGADGEKWNLPAEVTIPPAGEITVTATADNIGAIRAPANSITKIATPTLGWQTVNNPDAASPGRAVETDAELRQRQTVSTMLPSLSVMDGIIGAVLAVDGVVKARGYENDTGEADAYGIPAHSICIVAEGGDAQEIADAIAKKKTAGAGTYGTTEMQTLDKYGVASTTRFSRPIPVAIGVHITLTAKQGYSTGTAETIRQNVADYVAGLGIGETVSLSKIYSPANLSCSGGGDVFDIQRITLDRDGGTPAEASIQLAYNEMPTCDVNNVEVIAQ